MPTSGAVARRSGRSLKITSSKPVPACVDGGSLFGSLGWDWQPNDAIHFTAQAEFNSLQAPVRARRAGTTADRYAIGGQKSWFEDGELNWEVAWLSLPMEMNGSKRESMAANGSGTATGGRSSPGAGCPPRTTKTFHRRSDCNPSADLSAELLLAVRQQIRSDLSQEATIYGGSYLQEGVDAHRFNGLRYRLESEILRSSQIFAQAEWVASALRRHQ